MTKDEVLDSLKDVFETAELSDTTTLDDLAWDSMAMLSVIAIAKSQCGKRLTGADIRTFKTVGDIVAALA